MPELLWIFGFYAVSAAWVHAVMGRNNAAPRRHYVLVAGNQACRMEWYIRALRYFSRRNGTDIAITVVLDGSTDETGNIVKLFAREHESIRLVLAEQSGSEEGSCGSVIQSGEPAETQRQRMVREWEGDGGAASPGQVIWVDLNHQEDLRQLPI